MATSQQVSIRVEDTGRGGSKGGNRLKQSMSLEERLAAMDNTPHLGITEAKKRTAALIANLPERPSPDRRVAEEAVTSEAVRIDEARRLTANMLVNDAADAERLGPQARGGLEEARQLAEHADAGDATPSTPIFVGATLGQNARC